MTDFIRTPESNFHSLKDFDFAPNYHRWQDLRIHYLDEGEKDSPIALLVHGMPTWSYLYKDMIPGLVKAGYRCIVPDHAGFGKSDKPTDKNWYSIARHTEILTSLIYDLNLTDITLVCQDWGGPTGLAQVATMPDRFKHLVILNTWLHHDEFTYSPGVKRWNKGWQPGGRFDIPKPDLALLLLLNAGHIAFPDFAKALASNQLPELSEEGNLMYEGYRAPYKGLPDQAFNGYRKFPVSIPLNDEGIVNGNAFSQRMHFHFLKNWSKKIQFIWGGQDDVFTEQWGKQWAEIMKADFHCFPDAGHFLQSTHGKEISNLIVNYKG